MEKEKLWIILAVLVIALSIAGTFWLNSQQSDEGTNAYGSDAENEAGTFIEGASEISVLGSDDEVFSEIDSALGSLE